MSQPRDILHLLFHPIAGYEEMKLRKRFSVLASIVLVILFFSGEVIKFRFYGFGINHNNPNDLNTLIILARTVLLFVLWCISNWLFCILFEGKGFFKEVWVASAYAMTPYIIFTYANILISNLVVAEEIVLTNYLSLIGTFWSVVMMIIAIKIIHDYSLSKTLIMSALTILGIGVVLFLMLLSLTVYQQVFAMFRTIVNEIIYRL